MTVARAACDAGDHPESALQGQVPASLRSSGGFVGFHCNLHLLAQDRGEGAGWQHVFVTDREGRRCSYFDTSPSTVGRQHNGVVVVDTTNSSRPRVTGYLASPAMKDPMETLKVGDQRQLLVAVEAVPADAVPQIDIYDLAADCREPRLLSPPYGSNPTGRNDQGSIRGTDGALSRDGRTYFMTALRTGTIFAIDISDPAKPAVLAQWSMPFNQRTGGMAVNDDGNRAYFTLYGQGAAARGAEPGKYSNGVVIADISDVQLRKPRPQVKVLSSLVWGDGGGSHQLIPVKIKGRDYLIASDENGAAESNATGWRDACNAGLPPWSFTRIIDINDESAPVIVSKLRLEIDDAKNCMSVLPDLTGLNGFTYGSHACSVDNRQDATTLACGNFESGIRVFDIRDPRQPREIAYFVPPAPSSPAPGSLNNFANANGRPDHCSAQARLDAPTATLTTTCQDSGLLVLEFTHGVWPFPETTTPVGQQN